MPVDLIPLSLFYFLSVSGVLACLRVGSLPLPLLDALVLFGFYTSRKRKSNEIECVRTPFSTLAFMAW